MGQKKIMTIKKESRISRKKETIKISIDKYDADCGTQFYRVCDAHDWNSPADCCSGAGWYINEYQIDSDISIWEEHYNIIIVKDYR